MSGEGIDRVAGLAAADPNAAAIILTGDRTISWGEFDARVHLATGRLAARGVKPADRVIVSLDSGLEAAEAIFAINRLGATVVAIPTAPPESQLEPLVSRVKPRLFLQPGSLEGLPPADTFHRRLPKDDDPVCVVFTSGSGGAPRGVVLSQGNWDSANRAAAQTLRLLPGDRWVACLPVHHVGGYSIYMRAAETGFAVVPVAQFEPEAVIEAIDKSSATAISLVPTMLSRLLEAGWTANPTLRFVLLGGGPCPESILHEALDRRIPIAPTYGLTEACSQVATLPPWDTRGRLRTAGRPLPGVRVRIADAPDRPMKRGTPGQIWVSGPTLAQGTLDGPLPTQEGWYGTGDLGMLDGEEFLTVLGRIDDLILTGGEKVVPAEVEEALTNHPAVAEACVIGIPDDEWGQRAVAAVVLLEGTPPGTVGPSELRALLKKELMYHKVPRQIVIMDELPRTGPDKIDRAELRRQLKKEATS